jgi:hypothetical protein
MARDTSMFEHVKHPQQNLSGQTLHWLGEDNKENFQRHQADQQKRKFLENSGWIDTEIEYSFNQHAFRSPEFDAGVDHICVFGCSMTFGVGINQHQRYSDMLAKDLGTNCYNFGVSGGNDSASFRLAYTWLPKLKPSLVVYQTTFPERFEIIENNHSKSLGVNAALGGNVPIGQGDMYKIWMVNEENSQLLALKNQLAMQALCQNLNIKLIQITHEDFFGTWDTCARDTHHPGHDANKKVLDTVKQKL